MSLIIITRWVCRFRCKNVLFILYLLFSLSSGAPQKGLEVDLTRIVRATEADNWFMDSDAYEEVLDQFMPSVCRVADTVVEKLYYQIEQEVGEAGDAKTIFHKTDEVTDEVENALHAHRKLVTLKKAMKLKKECPFWVSEQKNFKPRQSGEKRFLFAVESGGMLQLRVGSKDFKTGGGGASRLFGFYGLNSKISLLGGLEFGGGAFVRPENPEEDVDLRFFPAIPTVLRFHNGAWHGDIEAAVVTTFSSDKLRLIPGWRLGTMIGFSTLRLRNLLPWAGIAIAVEQYPLSREQKGVYFKIGFRAGTIFMNK